MERSSALSFSPRSLRWFMSIGLVFGLVLALDGLVSAQMQLTQAVRDGRVRLDIPRFSGYSRGQLRIINQRRDPIEIDVSGSVIEPSTGNYQPLLIACPESTPGVPTILIDAGETFAGRFMTFCLDAGAACPSSNVQYRLRASTVPRLYEDALAFFLAHPDLQPQVQGAIWSGGDMSRIRIPNPPAPPEPEAEPEQSESPPDPEMEPSRPIDPIEGVPEGAGEQDALASLQAELRELRQELNDLLDRGEPDGEGERAAYERAIDDVTMRINICELRLADAIAAANGWVDTGDLLTGLRAAWHTHAGLILGEDHPAMEIENLDEVNDLLTRRERTRLITHFRRLLRRDSLEEDEAAQVEELLRLVRG